MSTQTDHPWVSSIVALAILVTLTSCSKTPASPPLGPAASVDGTSTAVLSAASPPVAAASGLPPAPSSAALPLPAQPQIQQAATDSSPPGTQIWECVTNGLKTFSNNPCGDKSSLVSVRPINTMNATPPVRSARAYTPERAYAAEPAYAQPYAEQNSYSDQDGESDQDSVYAGNSYAVLPGFAYVPKKRHEHPHRPPHHDSGPPRRN
jgi:hypothetical protein